jgi:myosin V
MASWEVGTRAWFPNQAEGFIPGELAERKRLGDDKIALVFNLADDSRSTVETTEATLAESQNASLPPLMNPPMFEAAEDLTNLSHLNEPAILHAIKLRYAQKEIYTYSGLVLIATNPFARVDSLYVPQMVQVYTGKQRASQAPHLFAIAEEAYAQMLRDLKNQTVVVSGESGAGKTVSAKYIMRYFATRVTPGQASKGSKKTDAISETEEQILATNPVMEAFGNAKTTRNDNSSRFGKYIEIMFDKNTDIIGARIRTYLLERSRLVFQPLKERNYHIFYQLVAGVSDDERQDLGLLSVEEFDYLNQGNDPVIDGVDDAAEFAATKKSLTTINVSEVTQREIFRVLAALLHIGNIKIAATRNDSSLSSSEPALVKACQILGIDAGDFAKWTVKKQLITRGEKITSNLTQQQATVVRDSVAKFIYSSLFDWLVETINHGLATDAVLQRLNTFIGVLDIYGFEHFAKNSFEQFCINYANEKLQQEFNQHVFKLEQEEYMSEQIDWTFIDFSDNQPCIDLIEGKLGILSLLDEESRLPMGSDEQFVTKLHHHFAADKQKFYKKPRFGKSAFTVCHYALDVTYESDGFIDKNRDTVPDEQMEVLKKSNNAFLLEVLDVAAAVREKDSAQTTSKTVATGGGRRVGVAVNRKPTLGGIFKSSLIELMQTINGTDAHYIRCIKPNEAKESWKFEGPMVLSQLRACGVLETVRISTAGYPTRWTYEEFAHRYFLLCRSPEWRDDARSMAQNILVKALGKQEHEKSDKYQLGLTKIFFRAGMLAFLESRRTARLKECAIMIQKNLRAKYYRHKYLDARQSVIDFQTATRAFLARRRAEETRMTKAATDIQRFWRGQKVRKDYMQTRNDLILFESIAKGYLCRKNILETRIGNAAITIQRAFRSWRSLRAWRQYRRKVVIVQNLYRGRVARRDYKKLRAEARDLKQISYKLENKVVELTQSLGTLKRDNKGLQSQLENYESQLKSWRSRHNALEERSRELQGEANQAGIVAARLAALEEEHAKLQTSHDEHMGNAKRLQDEQRKLQDSLRTSNTELDRLRQSVSTHESERGSLRQQINELQDQLEIARRAPPPPPATNGAAVNGEYVNGTSNIANGLINLVSSKKPLKRRSAGAAERSEQDRYSGVYNARPMSMALDTHMKTLSGSTFNPTLDSVEAELENLLAQEEELNDEVTMGLIRGIKIPQPGANPPPTDKEVLFPSYLINLVTSEMWNNGFVKESERFLANVMQSIQQEVMQHEGEEAINPGAFWLSNVHEMLSFVFLAEDWYEAQKTDNYEYDRLLEIVKHDLESLEFNIYHTWMKVLKKKLHKMIVPAIIESQSLPGFVTNESNRFLGKLLPSNNTPAYSMDNLLSLLNNVFKAMKAYYLEDSIITQTVTELLRLVGVTAFNDLLMRRNFLSWKRGLQINYNITRIEEWCKSHDMPEGTLQLEHLMQATKLLQLKKATLNDIEIIQDICWMLSPNQIQKLLNQYLVADYEQPINGEIMKAVASRVTEKSDVLLLAPVDMEDSGPYEIAEPRVITALETYTPSCESSFFMLSNPADNSFIGLQTPRLKRLAEIVSAQAMAQQDHTPEGAMSDSEAIAS